MSPARVAVQLDPATELDDFRTAAVSLVTHGLVTDRWPAPGILRLVRLYEEPLRSEFGRLCHWRLDVAPTCARLLRRPAAVSAFRPARTATPTRRPFAARAYVSLCLVLASLEALGEQTTIQELANEAARLRAGDDAIAFDLTVHAHRRSFVDAVGWLAERGVLTLVDGDSDAFLRAAGDALYDVDRDAASRLLLSPPSVLAGLTATEDFLEEPYPPTAEGAQARARHHVHRRLLTESTVYYEALGEDERDFARQRRTRIREELERLTGCTLESRFEGLALVGMPAAEPFPSGGSVAQAALVLGGELAGDAAPARGAAPLESERVLDGPGVEKAWRRVLAVYAGRFTAEYRAEPERLRDEAVGLLTRLGLVRALPTGGLAVQAALARYRADVRLPEVLGA